MQLIQFISFSFCWHVFVREQAQKLILKEWEKKSEVCPSETFPFPLTEIYRDIFMQISDTIQVGFFFLHIINVNNCGNPESDII